MRSNISRISIRWVLSTMLIALLLYYAPLLTALLAVFLAVMISADGLVVSILAGLSGAVAGAVAGLLGACGQGPDLDELFSEEHSWVPVSTIGWAGGGFILLFAISEISNLLQGAAYITYLLVWAFVFCIVGISQWLWLRREVQKAYLWIPITLAAWGIGLLLVSTSASLLFGMEITEVIGRNMSAILGSSGNSTFLGNFFGLLYWILVGCVAGVITDWGLRFLALKKTQGSR